MKIYSSLSIIFKGIIRSLLTIGRFFSWYAEAIFFENDPINYFVQVSLFYSRALVGHIWISTMSSAKLDAILSSLTVSNALQIFSNPINSKVWALIMTPIFFNLSAKTFVALKNSTKMRAYLGDMF